MRALIHDLSVGHDHDAVGIDHGAQAVGDDEDGPPVAQGADGLVDLGLRVRVDLAGGLVEDEDRRVAPGSPGRCRCAYRWPPDKPMPPSPSTASYPKRSR